MPPRKATAASATPTPAPHSETKKALVRSQVLEHAARLFADHGFAGTSLQDIAAEMGVSRAAIYYYFPNKDALLSAIVEEVTISAASDVERLRGKQQGGSAAERLRGLVYQRVRYILDRGQLIRVMELSANALPPALAERSRIAKRRILDNYVALLTEGIEAGEFRPVDTRVAAFALIGMGTWTAWWFDPTRGRNAEQVASQMAEMAVASLLAEPTPRGAGSMEEALRRLREDIDAVERLASKIE